MKIIEDKNPEIIPRNHLVEDALSEAEFGEMKKFNEFIEILKKPYEDNPKNRYFQHPRKEGQRFIKLIVEH